MKKGRITIEDKHSPGRTKACKGLERGRTWVCPQSPRKPHGCDRVSRRGQREMTQKKNWVTGKDYRLASG